MGIFKTDAQPTSAELRTRITGLEARLAEIEGEIKKANEEAAVAYGTTGDAASVLATLKKLNAERDVIISSLPILDIEQYNAASSEYYAARKRCDDVAASTMVGVRKKVDPLVSSLNEIGTKNDFNFTSIIEAIESAMLEAYNVVWNKENENMPKFPAPVAGRREDGILKIYDSVKGEFR